MRSGPYDPYGLGYTRNTMVTTKRAIKAANGQPGAICKKLSQSGLIPATRDHEVEINSNRRSELLR